MNCNEAGQAGLDAHETCSFFFTLERTRLLSDSESKSESVVVWRWKLDGKSRLYDDVTVLFFSPRVFSRKLVR